MHSVPNGYILFCEWKRPRLPKHILHGLEKGGQVHQKAFQESGRMLGEEWQRQTDGQKDWWKRIASRNPSNFPSTKLNPYMLFSAVHRDDLVDPVERADIASSGRKLGEAWRSLSPSERQFWENQVRNIWG